MQAQQCVQSSGTNHPNGLTILSIASRNSPECFHEMSECPSGLHMKADLVAIAEWKYPFPSRTRKSSALTPMVLHSCGRVGSRQVFFYFYAIPSVMTASRLRSLPDKVCLLRLTASCRRTCLKSATDRIAFSHCPSFAP